MLWVLKRNAGQLCLGSSRPESSRTRSSRPGPILSLVGMCLIKKSLFNKSWRKGVRTKKHKFLRRLFHFLYHTRDTRYQLMSVLSVPDLTNQAFIKKMDTFHANCLIRLLIAKTDFTY